MTNVEVTPQKVEDFRRAQLETRDYYRSYLEPFSQRAYEYGQQAIKVLITLNGGAVALLPALAQLSPADVGITARLYLPAAFFLMGLVFSLVVTYLAHLNFQYLFDVTENMRRRSEKELQVQFLGKELSEEAVGILVRKIGIGDRLVKLTFWGPHVFGIGSLAAFCAGAILTLGATAR